jgi:hypothetical protein
MILLITYYTHAILLLQSTVIYVQSYSEIFMLFSFLYNKCF